MSVIRIEKTRDYTVMSNNHLKNKEMSLKAKGLLSLMLSLPDDWDYSIQGLVKICKENKTCIMSTLNELKKFGFLRINKKLPSETKSGRYEYEYIVYEIPIQDIDQQPSVKQYVENQHLENLNSDNQTQLITDISTNKELITSNTNTNNKWLYFESPILEDAFKEFVKVREKKKKPLTERALNMLMKQLYSLSTVNGVVDEDLMLEIIERSIMHSWDSFYKLPKPTKQDIANMEDIDCGAIQ